MNVIQFPGTPRSQPPPANVASTVPLEELTAVKDKLEAELVRVAADIDRVLALLKSGRGEK